MQDHLRRHLVLVFLSAIAYNSQATFNYLDKHGIAADMIGQIIDISNGFQNSYERKLYLIGLSCMIA
jgi:hypothetical protein